MIEVEVIVSVIAALLVAIAVVIMNQFKNIRLRKDK